MLIPTVRGGKQGMPLFIMQQDQRATSQDGSAAAPPVLGEYTHP
jgi:hypothetical protein